MELRNYEACDRHKEGHLALIGFCNSFNIIIVASFKFLYLLPIISIVRLKAAEASGPVSYIPHCHLPHANDFGDPPMNENSPGPRILLVDDDPSISKLLECQLTPEGYSCQIASSGEEALKRLRGEPFGVVISDLQMPKISGLELLEMVSKQYPHIVFLIVTGVDDLKVGIQAMKQGADDYLVKPFQLDIVLVSIQKALHKKQLEKEIEDYRHNLEERVDLRTNQWKSAMKRIEITYDETLEALGGALDLRDNETAGHSQRVKRYCLILANTVRCSAEELDNIARGAYLHDIGKIGIPDAILLKPGKLSPEERKIMQSHARIGYDLVSRIGFLAPAAAIVLTHQERWDGTGYPQGLLEKEIPLGSRLFAVADTLDAMTSDRPYRLALSFSEARQEIESESGRQFDPDIVRVFLSVPEQIWEEIRKEITGQGFK